MATHSFKSRVSSNSVSAPTGSSNIPFDTIIYDDAGGFNTTTFEYTVQTGGDGDWSLKLAVALKSVADQDEVAAEIYLNGNTIAELKGQAVMQAAEVGALQPILPLDLRLSQGDVLLARVYNSSATSRLIDRHEYSTYFSGVCHG